MAKTIKQLIEESHKTAIDRGWWDDIKKKTFGDQCANFHGEISEAWEDYRDGHGYTEIYYEPKLRFGTRKTRKPCGIPIELADLLIRVFDTCGHYHIDLEKALKIKMEYNKTRAYRHGGKRA